MSWKRDRVAKVPPDAQFFVAEEYHVWKDDQQNVVLRTPVTIDDGRFVIENVYASGGYGLILDARDTVFPKPHRRVLIKTSRYELSGDEAIFEEGTSRLGARGFEKIIRNRDYLQDEARYLLEFNAIPGIPALSKFVEDWSPQLLGPHMSEGRECWIRNVAIKRDDLLPLEEVVGNEVYLVLQYIPGKPANIAGLPPVGSSERRRVVWEYLRIIAGFLSRFHRRREFRGIFLEDAREKDDCPTEGYHVYQDLKPENIIVSSGGQLFLIDFGAMDTIAEDPNTRRSMSLYDKSGLFSQGYAAPEVLALQPASDLIDIFSFGCTACHLLLDRPYPVQKPGDIPALIREIEKQYDRLWAEAVAACLKEEPEGRRKAIDKFGQKGRTSADKLRNYLEAIR
jgi:serine/threonine protein kinase